MKQETKAEQIERLQGNDKGYYALVHKDKVLLLKIIEARRTDIVFCDSNGDWCVKGHALLNKGNIYRIHRDYKPEPDTPVFPGYVLCEVYIRSGGRRWFKGIDNKPHCLNHAINLGCCGYVPKEKIKGKWARACMPVIFTDPDKTRILAAFSDGDPVDGAQQIPLGWVMFKETE